LSRWLPFIGAAIVAATGIAALVLGMRAREANEPTRFGPYSIESRVEGEAKYFDLIRDGKVARTLAGSLDTLCDPPTIAELDVDDDGKPDLYFRNCRGHGFLSQHGDELAYTDLAGPEPTNWWALQVFSGGVKLVLVGIGACIAALISFAIAGARLKPTA
jgi:hypothetical protein